jgi:hypothetical protein
MFSFLTRFGYNFKQGFKKSGKYQLLRFFRVSDAAGIDSCFTSQTVKIIHTSASRITNHKKFNLIIFNRPRLLKTVHESTTWKRAQSAFFFVAGFRFGAFANNQDY